MRRITKRKRTAQIGFVMTETERAALEYLVEVEGEVSMAAVLRSLIRRTATERGFIPSRWRPQSQMTEVNNAKEN